MNPENDSTMTGRPLEGKAIGISVALGEDHARCGYGAEEMNRTVVRLSEVLLSAGARLVFGHDWRPSGIMSAIARLAVAYDEGGAAWEDRPQRSGCRITNLVPWGRTPELPLEIREDLEERGLLRIEVTPMPGELADRESEFGQRIMLAASLSATRRRLASLCDARICLGGKYHRYEGFFPGVLEEALDSASQPGGSPILVSSMMGGLAGMLVTAAKEKMWDKLPSLNGDPEIRKGYDELRASGLIPLPDIEKASYLLDWNSLQKRSRLSPGDWECLTGARDIEVVCAMAVKALGRGR